jgi:hypothetical protein
MRCSRRTTDELYVALAEMHIAQLVSYDGGRLLKQVHGILGLPQTKPNKTGSLPSGT